MLTGVTPISTRESRRDSKVSHHRTGRRDAGGRRRKRTDAPPMETPDSIRELCRAVDAIDTSFSAKEYSAHTKPKREREQLKAQTFGNYNDHSLMRPHIVDTSLQSPLNARRMFMINM